jgi:hypothetical protein
MKKMKVEFQELCQSLPGNISEREIFIYTFGSEDFQLKIGGLGIKISKHLED